MTTIDEAVSGLAWSAAIVFAGTLVGRILGLLGQVVIIRSLSPSAFGTIALVYTGLLTISRIGLLGVPNGVTRLFSAKSTLEDRYEILKSGYLIILASGGILTGIVYLSRNTLAAVMGESEITGLIVAFIPLIILSQISAVSISALRAQQKSLQMSLSKDIIPRSAAILVFLIFAYLNHPFDGAIAYWLVIPLITTILAALFLVRNLSNNAWQRGFPQIEIFRELWLFSWPLAVATSLVLIMANLDVLMIGYFLNSVDVGFYRAVQPLRQVTQFILQSFVFLFLPLATEFYNKDEFEELRTLYNAASKWTAVLTLPFVLVFSLFSGSVIQVFFTVEYLPAAPALSALTAGLFFNAFVGPNGAMIQAIDRSKLEMYAAIIGVAINIALNIIFIPKFGIIGAAFATIIGYMTFNSIEVVGIYFISGAHPFSWNTIKPLAVTTTAGVIIRMFGEVYSTDLVGLISIGILLVIIQAGSLIVTRSIDETDRYLFEKVKHRLG